MIKTKSPQNCGLFCFVVEKSNKQYNQTIIMITHNLEIAKTADRILRIEDGKICEN